MPTFSLIERKILQFAQLQAFEPATAVAKQAGVKPANVLTVFRKLEESNQLYRRPMINYAALGYAEYEFMLRPSGPAKKSRAALLNWLRMTPHVTSVAELGGTHTYEVNLIARSAGEVVRLFSSLLQKLPGQCERVFAIRAHAWLYGTKSLGGLKKPPAILEYSCEGTSTQLEKIDQQILEHLVTGTITGLSDLAKRMECAISTVQYRLEKLKKSDVIRGYFYDLSAFLEGLGIQGCYVVLRTSAAGPEFTKRLHAFCKIHQHVDKLYAELGGWDYKIMLRVPDSRSISNFVDEVGDEFGEYVSAVETYPIIQLRSASQFLLR